MNRYNKSGEPDGSWLRSVDQSSGELRTWVADPAGTRQPL